MAANVWHVIARFATLAVELNSKVNSPSELPK